MTNFLVSPTIQYRGGKADPYTFPLSEWIQQGASKADLSIIGVPLSKSSITFSGAHTHPESFRKLWSSFQAYNWDEDVELNKLQAADFGDVAMHVTDILQCHRNIAGSAEYLWREYPSTTGVFIGGDHSITYPIIAGLARATSKRIGLIHFDAHLDVRDTKYGGPSNGTPMRSLLEKGVLRGEDMVTIGLRSFANSKPYRSYAEEKGMTLFSSNDVKKKGMQPIVEWAKDYLEEKVDIVYLTYDIDVLDQCYVPGVPAIGPSGVSPDELFWSAQYLGQWSKVVGMDMVCVDPTRDVRDMSSRVALHVFLNFATGRCL
ncbi:agmatinase family protein [Ammoniphilus sp. CFH 90114]|uniref:agmatinase family protein n=1 Tax=Ammoniphilus sp. CFH 90114 TaxID=2493665 RepID=UPI00100F8666|nr:agmatinase family protein [Ammoniphilus sp. CFH 90114]RXT15479.1 formimidoylglutamase [Ammoniphilus sp. CFH 90114]